ncbi:MAG: hypothetical protein RIT27_1980 [Pseudomonadota bacterium]|jgi:PAS domain S-box-containing protein
MNDVGLFQKEETLLADALHLLATLPTQPDPLATRYRELVLHYQKLLKQTKLLIKVSDRQQRDKINEVQQVAITNEQRLAQFLEAIPLGVFVVNHERKPYYANQAAFQIFYHQNSITDDMEELIKLYDQNVEQNANEVTKKCLPLEQALLYGKACSGEIALSFQNQLIPLEISSMPIFDQKGRVSYVIVVFKNISERKQAEADKIRLIEQEQAKLAMEHYSQKIEEKNQQLIQLNQEKNEFLGIVAHDLKNPLGNIMSLADIIIENQSPNETNETYEYARLIKISADSMFSLVTTLLDVNAIESGQVNLFLHRENLLPLIQHVLNDYKSAALKKNISLHFHFKHPYYYAMIDKNITKQIFDNLISNAIKYSPLGKNVSLNLYSIDQKIRCEIRDEGQGLSQEEISKLFNKFTRLKPQPTAGEHSTGLGLFIVKKLVEKMRGNVWCESELNIGSTFIVEFPEVE